MRRGTKELPLVLGVNLSSLRLCGCTLDLVCTRKGTLSLGTISQSENQGLVVDVFGRGHLLCLVRF